MNKEAIEKEIARLNKKIEFEMGEVKSFAAKIVHDKPEQIAFFNRSRELANLEKSIIQYIERRETLKDILVTL